MGAQANTNVLFSDIRDFTEFTAKQGDRLAFNLLRLHNQIVQKVCDLYQGQLIKTYGDGAMAHFDDPANAVAAAIDLQIEANTHTQNHPHIPLLVGVGIHHGEVIEEQGDLFGLAVNFTKRLADEARSGQIVVSDAILEKLDAANHKWMNLGEHAIKGIGSVSLYEIIWRKESMRLTTQDQTLNLILTHDDKLVIELGKYVRQELDALRDKLTGEKASMPAGVGWLFKKMDDWLPTLIDKALGKLGIGIEHPLNQVRLWMDNNRLLIRIGERQFDLNNQWQGKGFDQEKLKQFIEKIHERQQALGGVSVRLKAARPKKVMSSSTQKQREKSESPPTSTPPMKLFFLALSENKKAQQAFSSWPIARKLVKRFVAGETFPEAIEVARQLNQNNILATLNHLGEHTRDIQIARQTSDKYLNLLDAIKQSGVQTTVSIKPTQIGLSLGKDACDAELAKILSHAQGTGASICIDMEDSEYTQTTLELFAKYHQQYGNQISTVIQANLRRSFEDIQQLIKMGAPVRIVKGAYLEPEDIAFQQKKEVDQEYVRLIQALLSPQARQNGVYTAIASHDEHVLRWVCEFVQQEKISTDHYEFQMLYGIRRDLQKKLADAGHRVRVYVTYGTEWYPYFMRRLAERPANVFFLLKNLFRA